MNDRKILAPWMQPTIDEVRHRSKTKSEGLMTAKERVIKEKILAELPVIIKEQDFAKLVDVVAYLLSK